MEIHEAIGLDKRERPKRDRVDDAEDRDARADAERERRERNEREELCVPETAQREAEVRDQRVHGKPPAGVARATPVVNRC